MQDHTGIFIALEGSDGSGKTTQFNLLKERLEAVGYDVEVFKFPQYDQDSSHFVRRYLNGDYGPASDINPYTASLFYALDRFEGAPRIRKALEAGTVVLSDRYAGANMAHQGAKFGSAAEKRGFFVWADSMEFQLLGIPRPDINIYLRVPADLSYELISKREARGYTDKSHDQHEGDINHLRAAVETYDLLCQLFPKDFYAVNCTYENKMLSIPAINNTIWEQLQPLLRNLTKHKASSKVVNLNDVSTQNSEQKQELKVSSFDTHNVGQPLRVKLNQLSLLSARNLSAITGVDAKLELTKKPAFYTPRIRNQQLSKRYSQVMSEIAARHQLILKVLQKSKNTKLEPAEMLLAATPLAFQCNIEVRAESAVVKKMISSLSDSKLEELSAVSQKLYSTTHEKRPNDFNAPVKRVAAQNHVTNPAQIVGDLPETLVDPESAAQIITAIPRNEFELITDDVYASSSLAKSDLAAAVDNFSYEQKAEFLRYYLETADSKPGLIHAVSYEWEMVASGVALNYLMNNKLMDAVTLQPATPRYGYEVPNWAEPAGVEELFMDCFDDSLSLFSELQEGGYHEEAQYAVLMGHRLRWQASTSLGKILKLKVLASSLECPAEVKSLFEAMQSAVAQAHPMIGEWLVAWQVPAEREPVAVKKTTRSTKTAEPTKPRGRQRSRRSRQSNKKTPNQRLQ